jgi:hypothetical protein
VFFAQAGAFIEHGPELIVVFELGTDEHIRHGTYPLHRHTF